MLGFFGLIGLTDYLSSSQQLYDGFLCNVWQKVDFIWYYEDVVTKRPVHWVFYTGRSIHVMTSKWEQFSRTQNGKPLYIVSTKNRSTITLSFCFLIALESQIFMSESFNLFLNCSCDPFGSKAHICTDYAQIQAFASVINSWPIIGGLIRFLKEVMLREEYPKLGSVFTLNLLNKNITFFIGPEVSAHFSGPRNRSQPTGGLSVQCAYFWTWCVFDVDYTIRQEQFGSLLITQELCGEVDLKYELEHLIILTASRCLLGEEVRNKLFDDALFHDLDNRMLPLV
ncbi:hypothetical protein HAX54_004454 [Datura stramonium]|uniref:Uncharacterized protein n=1 Tax=Datura stramonium TaxID=4076 RepID=A0ABS8T9B9_DATST|nr:hypothetical protein [Datura stramonium]